MPTNCVAEPADVFSVEVKGFGGLLQICGLRKDEIVRKKIVVVFISNHDVQALWFWQRNNI